MIAVVKEQARGRVPLLAGAAALATAETIERARFAERVGYQAAHSSATAG